MTSSMITAEYATEYAIYADHIYLHMYMYTHV